MGRKQTLTVVVFFLLVVLIASSHVSSSEPKRWIDLMGYAELSATIGVLGGGDYEVPLRLKLNTRGGNGVILPSGWTIPLIESRLVQTDERNVEAWLPNGERISFRLREDGGLESGAGYNASREGGAVSFEYGRKFYRFDKGRIREMIVPTGEKFEWRYRSDNDIDIYRDGRSVFRSTRHESGSEGVLDLNFIQNRSTCRIHYDVIPDIVSKNVAALRGRAFPTVYRIEMSDGGDAFVEVDDEGSSTLITVENWPDAVPDRMVLELDKETRLLRRMNEFSFHVEDMAPTNKVLFSVPRITVTDANSEETKLLQKGKFRIDKGRPQVEIGLEDTVEKYYLSTSSGRKLRKRVVNGQEVFRGYYDEEGRNLITVEEGVRIDWSSFQEGSEFQGPH